MRKILSCEFNLDTACVELRLDDGMLSQSSSMMAQSCLNLEISIPTKYMDFLLCFRLALLVSTDDLSMYSRK